MKNDKGFTLIELMVSIAVVGVLSAIAIPSFLTAIERQKVKAAAEALSQKIYLAKSESMRSGKSVYFSMTPGTSSCYGFKLGSACDCAQSTGTANSCDILQKTLTKATDGVSIPASTFSGNAGNFEAIRGTATPGSVTLQSTSGYTIKASISLTGHVQLCSPSGFGNVNGYPTTNC